MPRDDAAAPGRRDLAPLATVLGPLLRGWWVIVAAAVAAGLVVALVGGGPDEAQASARVGLTDEVRWPFYDVARDRFAVVVETPAVQEAAEAAADGPIELTVDQPVDQAYVDVVGVAATTSAAVAGTQAAVDAALVDVRDAALGVEQAAVERLAADLAALDDRLATVTQDIDDLLVAEQGDGVDAARAESSREALEQERNVLARDRATTAGELREAERELVAATEALDVQLVRPAAPPEDEGAAGRFGPLTLAAALGGAVLAAIVLLVRDRRSGRVTDPWYVSDLLGVEVLAVLDEDRRSVEVTRLAHRIGPTRHDGTLVCKVVGTGTVPSDLTVSLLATWLADAGTRTLGVRRDGARQVANGSPRTPYPQTKNGDRVGGGGRTGDVRAAVAAGLHDLVLVDAGDELLAPTADMWALRLPGPLLLAVAIGDPLPRVRALVDAARESGTAVLGAVLLDARLDTHRRIEVTGAGVDDGDEETATGAGPSSDPDVGAEPVESVTGDPPRP